MSGDSGAPADCRHFRDCGGCSRLDQPYAAERIDKERAFDALLRGYETLCGVSRPPILAAERPLGYRTSLKVPFRASPRGPLCGFYARGSHRVVDLHECRIQHPALVEVLLAARELAAECAVPIYHEHVHRGVLRHLLARIGPGTGEILVGLVVRRAGAPQVKRMAWRLYERLRERGVVGVVENTNPERTNAVLGRRTRRLVGRAVMFEEQDGLRLRTSIDSFAQVHADQARRLFAEVTRLLEPKEGERVVDLYSGYGAFGLRLAQAGARVVCIERNPRSVRDGRDIARFNDLAERVRFVAADAERGLAIASRDGGIDALVVDPPRRGLTPGIVEQLGRRRIARMAYVSCYPKTLLRDLDALASAYRVESIRLVDMFPRTDHVEAVALLSARDPA